MAADGAHRHTCAAIVSVDTQTGSHISDSSWAIISSSSRISFVSSQVRLASSWFADHTLCTKHRGLVLQDLSCARVYCVAEAFSDCLSGHK